MRRHAPALSLALVLSTAVLPSAAFGQAPAPPAQRDTGKWSIEDARAPTTTADFTVEEGSWMSVDVSPDGRTLVFDLLGHLYELPYAGGEARALTRGRSWNMQPRYSPDGRRILFTSDRDGNDDLWTLARGTDSLANVSRMDLPVYHGSWSADGRHVYGAHADHGGRSKGLRFNLHGTPQELIHTTTFQPVNQFVEDTARRAVYFEHLDRQLYASGARIKRYDLKTGELSVFIERPGGALNPTLSPDGRRLAYVHRDDRETVLVLHDLETRTERVLLRGLDRDRQEYSAYHYGVYPGIAWHPGGRELVLARGGKLTAVDVETGQARVIPFRARVQRELARPLRFPVAVPEGRAETRSHRWSQRTERGILFEALGDLHLREGARTRNLTSSPAHETSPVYDPRTRTVFYAAWTDDSLGAVYAQGVDGGARRRVTTRPAQYGALALSPDGRTLAFLRGGGRHHSGQRLENESRFELALVGPDGRERRVTEVEWTANFAGKHPPSVTFAAGGERLYFTEYVNDSVLAVKRVRLDGAEEERLYEFPHAVEAVVSPDARWIAFREYHRTFVTPLEWIGKTVTVSPYDRRGFSKRVDEDEDGVYLAWSADSRTLAWTRGRDFHEKAVDDIVAGRPESRRTELALAYDVAAPEGVVAFTGARVLTMDGEDRVLENATVVVRGSRIAAVGTEVPVPAGAKVYDLRGQTIMPGMVDSHAHYNSELSALNVVEQRHAGLLAALAHGVTTMYELYGTAEKDFPVSDLLRAGRITGPRLFSVGSPMYGLRHFRPRLFRPVDSYADAREHVRYNRDLGATALKDYVQFTREDRHQTVAAARELGLNVFSETAGNHPMNLTQVIDGVSGLEHS
ncbi:MAG TPA: hypothetical protein VFX98_13185, partial [Longimicrobiaceae bacterium]|nr:hypothetical protein [Longimicrobiaceae bacterium]